MVLKIYSTLSRKKEVFKPIKEGEIKIFVCGPTVYDLSHVGHAKTYTQFDIIVKYLRFKGYNVFYLQNITDIDDKIINRSNLEKVSWKELVKKYREAYISDIKSLGIDSVSKYANATDYIPEIVSQVERLIKKGFAYKISDGLYFDLTKDEEYGKLARRKLSEGEDAVSRIDENSEKKNSGDFCLWKFKKEGEPSWKTSLGEGRPGWHIEDTAITEKEFGSQYDIHGGGLDLIFPHHEAEIAQMESISGKKPLVRYWMHTGFLNIGKEKMGKSKGNFSTIRELIKLYSSEEIRYLFLSANYRKPIDFSPESLENAKSSLERLKNICDSITNDGKTNKNCLNEFEESMDDDFNTPNALQVLWKLVRDENANGKYQTIKKLDEIFGLKLLEKIEIKIPKKVNEFLEKREIARKNKKWEEADKLRDEIKSLGFQVLDGKEGQEIKEV
ncbi:cysteine--tRNA ligase [Candidatus Pacearchaeota archaeon CG09_land_8_20_14_0_10_30_9]|nr:cysteine--tRNA ligase [Candidatus Pacearchaeota archaeon]OIO40808.1 MAG: cysteine--tRNA ligase [Candidatus Pacearchaeota archaeon CG1_02_30_18]PIN71658.1 MAG: cysteine--tRNA ligase [Candidatus Pacearchaeota archaeon CG11_big_fil_rev_8_21_14_0_20_30_13]PIO00950.1 MAG: cysteine--tRNA ligase [Candidatus Pacearchaeota archaeon CG09_land_8_20_14_0_10_30_9]PIZ82183.1 MAG: cysteine--tRNA ligase [Candidatus Pacearchaeota archaeon CG_4_10_14_0_2_um_filter_30_11]PJA71676.1 MAG: cysteine--tRNA ligase 